MRHVFISKSDCKHQCHNKVLMCDFLALTELNHISELL